ncbi:MAG: hypothetical protein WHF31_15315 [Candidatus Dehalobacter alkaniphilus]
MKETKKTKEEMLEWLNEHKREHELLAFQALKNGGSQRYIQEANHKAKIVSDIIEIVDRETKIKPAKDIGSYWCGSCGQWIDSEHKGANFCSGCGKAIEWEKEQ